MNQLTGKTCVTCRIGTPIATEEEINEFMQQLANWIIVEVDKVKQLKRVFILSAHNILAPSVRTILRIAALENLAVE